MEQLTERLLKYIAIPTDSDPSCDKVPSTETQWNLARVLVEDLKEIGLIDVTLDEHCYVMGTLPANIDKEDVPTIGFISHLDTAPTYSGVNIKPRIVRNYDGNDIILNKELDIVLSPVDFPEMRDYIGQDLIVTDGTTLLGADDKAGISEILEAFKYLQEHPEIPHGEIKIGVTPDEEIGRGASLFDVEKFGCKFAYTVDGGEIGKMEYENFNAAEAVLKIEGRDIHPGSAKNSMVNAILIGMEFNSMLPAFERPEHTENLEGFFLLEEFNGNIENVTLAYIIRDHSMEKFIEKKELMEASAEFLRKKYPKARIELTLKDNYYNMKEKIEPMMEIMEILEKSMVDVGIKPFLKPIRGGSDGAQLSYKGLPCPNFFTGGHNFHGRYEYVCIQSMMKAKELIVKICENVTKL